MTKIAKLPNKEKKVFTFSLTERVGLMNILPSEGNVKQLVSIRDIRKKLELKQEDLKKFGISFEAKFMKMNEAGAKAKFDYDFTELEKLEIKGVLTKLDKENKLPDWALDLCLQFSISKALGQSLTLSVNWLKDTFGESNVVTE